jgi:uncharacterized protein (TIGR02444 family)
MQPLGKFAVDLYQAPGIAPLCLELQDSQGFDIPLLLFLCWHGYCVGEPDEPMLTQAISVSRQWTAQVVNPLRAARRWLKAGADGHTSHIELSLCFIQAGHSEAGRIGELREKIKNLELQAEFMQLDALEKLTCARCPKPGPGPGRCTDSLAEDIRETLRCGLLAMGLDTDTRKLEPLIAASVQLAGRL